MSNDVDFSKLEVSNDELLRGITSSALAAFQYMAKVDAVEDQKEVAQYSDSFIKGLTSLNEGWDDDLYKSVLESLEDIKTASTNSDYDEPYQKGLALTHELGTIAVDRLKVMEDALVAGETKVTNLYKDMKLLKGGHTLDALDLVKDIGMVDAGKIEGFATTSAKRLTNRTTNIADNLDYVATLDKIDADKILEGLQIDLSKASAEYYQKIAEEAGFGRLKTDEETAGIVDYYLPEDMQVNVSTYKNALAWLNKWEVYQSAKGVTSFEKELKHEETRVFDFVSQLGHSSDTGEIAAFGIIADGLLGDEEDVSAQLNALSEESPELAEKATEYLSELQDLFATGKYEPDFDALKKQAETLSSPDEGYFKSLTKAQQAIVTDQSNNVVADIKTLDQTIGILNELDDFEDMQLPHIAAEVEDLTKIPGRADNLKRSHVQILKKLVAQDADKLFRLEEEPVEAASYYTGAGKQHPLKKFAQASNIRDRYKALNEMTKRYIGPDGDELRPDEVNQLFASKIFGGFDTEQNDVFYALLQSFKSLDALSPLTKANVQTIGDF